MSADLIGFGCDLQQKLDAMDRKSRRARWAGDVAVALYGIAQRLHRLGVKVASGRNTPNDESEERRLMDKAGRQARKLGRGVVVLRQPNPTGWPLYVVFPGDVKPGSGIEAYYEQGVAVPPRP